MNFLTLMAVRQAGYVSRYHTEPGIDQDNAAHHWGVAMLLLYVDPQCTREALVYALQHDVAELFTGDTPAPVKWKYPDLKTILDRIEIMEVEQIGLTMPKLSPRSKALVKFCDSAELVLTCHEWMFRGNSYAYAPGSKVLRRMRDMVETEPVKNCANAVKLYHDLEGLYREHRERHANWG